MKINWYKNNENSRVNYDGDGLMGIRLLGKVLRYHQMAPLHTPSPLPTIHDHVRGPILKIKFDGLTIK